MFKALFLLILVVLALLSPFVGSVDTPLSAILDTTTLAHQIFFELRLPRFLLAFFSGALLALSGWLFQTLFRNALMTPFTLGISGGAVLGTGLAVILGLNTLYLGVALSGLFGFGGALLSVILLITLSRFIHDSSGNSLLLLGIALSFFFSAALMVLFSFASAMQSHEILRYTMGSLSTMGFTQAIAIAVVTLMFTLLLYLKRHELALLGISDDHARLKGVDTKALTYLLLTLASFAIGLLVSITGPIGFVGLIIPHIARQLYPLANYRLILPSALLGGLFLSACDTLSRLPQLQSEIPIGIVTAFIGGPFFIYLILKGK